MTEYENEVLIITTVGMAALWIRTFLLTKLTATLGPFLRIIKSMLWDIKAFLILLLASIISFAAIGSLLFGDVHEYDTLYHAFVHLFGASLGSFDFSLF